MRTIYCFTYDLLTYIYFYINGSFFHQINQTAIETHAAVVYAKIASGCLGFKLFNQLPGIFSIYIVEISLKNHFRFLGDVKYNWKESIDILS